MDFQQSLLYGCSSKKRLLHLLNTDYYSVNELKKIDKNIDSEYCFFYIDKKNPKNKTRKLPRKDLDCYRMICSHEKQKKQKKGSLKKIQKRLLFLLSTFEKQRQPYLHSGFKKISFLTNAENHVNKEFVLKFDLEKFFPSISKEMVYSFFKNKMAMSTDVAKICSILCTAPMIDMRDISNRGKKQLYALGQGLPTSTLLSYLINVDFFDEVSELADKRNAIMSVYVDDITFSSNSKFTQEFINQVFAISTKRRIKIQRSKVVNYRIDEKKVITGVQVEKTGTFIPNKKKFQIKNRYYNLLEELKKCQKNNTYITFKKYGEIYNMWIVLRGDIEHYKYVEKTVPRQWIALLIQLHDVFPWGIKKKSKGKPYSIENIKKVDFQKFSGSYQSFKMKKIKQIRM